MSGRTASIWIRPIVWHPDGAWLDLAAGTPRDRSLGQRLTPRVHASSTARRPFGPPVASQLALGSLATGPFAPRTT